MNILKYEIIYPFGEDIGPAFVGVVYEVDHVLKTEMLEISIAVAYDKKYLEGYIDIVIQGIEAGLTT